MEPISNNTIDVELLGKRIRLLRTDRQRTLAQVAGETGFSTGFLSQVENGQTNVSLSALYRIARALETSAPSLLALGAEPIVSVVRTDEGPWTPTDASDPTQLARRLTSTSHERVEARECVIPAGFRSDPPWSHAGEEYFHVLQGEVSVELANHGTEILHAGDSMAFPATVPHRWIGGDAEARVLYVIALPSGPSSNHSDGRPSPPIPH